MYYCYVICKVTDMNNTILSCYVVDDSSIQRLAIVKMIESHPSLKLIGEFSNAIETKAAIKDHKVDLIFLDIEMPGLDGYELTFEVRSEPSLAHAYIILHTSLSSAISVSQAQQVGANEALTKFDAKELVTSMLRGAKALTS